MRNGVEGKVRLVAMLVKDIGIPSVFALVLLGVIIGYIPSPLSQMARTLEDHAKADDQRTELIRQLCVNQAVATNISAMGCYRGRDVGK